jgi:hypothetical protein
MVAWPSRAFHGGEQLLLTPRASRSDSNNPSQRPCAPCRLQWLRETVDQRNHNSPRVLGFDIKRVEIWAIWSPIYKGFGLISKRIWSRSYFDSSIRLEYILVGINQKGKYSRRGTSSKWTHLGYWPWSVMPVWLGSIGPTGGSLGRTREKQGKVRLD